MKTLESLKTFLSSVPSRLSGNRVNIGSEHVYRLKAGHMWSCDYGLESRQKAARDRLVAAGGNVDRELKP